MDDPRSDDDRPEETDAAPEDDDRLDPEPIAADADDVREFAERMVDEPAAPMTQEGIINNP